MGHAQQLAPVVFLMDEITDEVLYDRRHPVGIQVVDDDRTACRICARPAARAAILRTPAASSESRQGRDSPGTTAGLRTDLRCPYRKCGR